MEEQVKQGGMTLSPEEFAEWQAMKTEQRLRAEELRRKSEREAYKTLVDKELVTTLEELASLSEQLATVKAKVYENWHALLSMKQELFAPPITEEEEAKQPESAFGHQYSHTFTHSSGLIRLQLGYNVVDDYTDLCEEGIQKVKDFISSLASDENSQMLVSAVLDLLAKDKNGTLKASRVLSLSQMARESGNADFIEGVEIIKESYQPTISKQYIRAYKRSPLTNAWLSIPLSVTEAFEGFDATLPIDKDGQLKHPQKED